MGSELETRDSSLPYHEKSVRLRKALEAPDLQEVESILCECRDLVHCTFGQHHVTLVQVICTLPSEVAIPFLNIALSHGAVVTLSDEFGRTPLHYAATVGDLSLAEFLVRNSAKANANPDLCSTVPRKHISGISQFQERIRLIPDLKFRGRTPLHQAAKCNHTSIVKLLLENRADVNGEDENGTTPLMLASTGVSMDTIKQYEDIVDILIQYNADVNVSNDKGKTPLHQSIALGSLNATKRLLDAGAKILADSGWQTPFHVAARQGAANCLSMLLEHDRTLLNQADADGYTALHKAAFAGSRDCVMLLLKCGMDLSAVTKCNHTVIDIILSQVPRPMHLFNDVFDSKITCNRNSIHEPDFEVTLDFSIFLQQNQRRQMSVVDAITQAANNSKTIHILKHPLIEAFLHLKWNSLRIFFYIWILMHFLFTLSLSTYIILIIHRPIGLSLVTYGSRIILFISATALLIHAIVQCLFIPRHYFNQYEVWMNLICICLSLAIAAVGENSPNVDDPSPCNSENKCTPDMWVLHASSITILLVWVELMFLIGRFPSYGYYALMFSAVLKNAVKVLLTFSCLVIGFALSFAVQFRLNKQFQNPWRALMKTSVMIMGELEYNDLFQIKEPNEIKTRLSGTSRAIFAIFIVVAGIVLMNLLVGLTVNDIQALQEDGHVRRLAKQLTFLSHIERLLNRLNLKYFPRCIYNYVYNNSAIGEQLVFRPAPAYIHKHRHNCKQQNIPQKLKDGLVKIALQNKKPNFDNEELADSRALKLIMDELLNIKHQLAELQANNNP